MTERKTVIALRGIKNTGKTTTIRAAYCKLSNSTLPKTPQDFDATMTVNGHSVAMISGGDVPAKLTDLLNKHNGCELIVCPTRSKGSTVQRVRCFCNEKEYVLFWMSLFFDGKYEAVDANGEKRANILVQTVRDFL